MAVLAIAVHGYAFGVPLGAIYLPDATTSAALIRFAQTIGASVTPRMTLGRQAPPHLTLLHVDGDPDAIKRWWTRVAESAPVTIEIKLRTLGFTPIREGDYYVPEGGVYVGCEAVRTRALDSAHRQAIDAAHENSLKIVSAAGDDFNPHITMGILDRMPDRAIELDAGLLPSVHDGRLALGQLGPYGTFPKIIERL